MNRGPVPAVSRTGSIARPRSASPAHVADMAASPAHVGGMAASSAHAGGMAALETLSSVPVVLRLTGVRELGQPQPTSAEYSFAVAFSGPVEQPLAQGTYEFVHPRMGSFALFIVPGAAGQGARSYEAVFNRLQA